MAKKITVRVLLTMLGLISAGFIALLLIFRQELCTLSSIKKINDYPFYEVIYKSNYYIDDFIKIGAASDAELANFVTRKVLKGLSTAKVNPNGACSTFCATTEDGDTILARNFDYRSSSVMLVKTDADNCYKSISFVNLEHIGYSSGKKPEGSIINKAAILSTPYATLDGMNERGLAVAVLVVKNNTVNQKNGNVPVMTTSAMRILLDKAANVDEAVKLLASFDMNSSGNIGYHFQIADASGKSVIIEYNNGVMKVVPLNENGFIAATNFSLTDKNMVGIGHDRYEMIMDNLKKSKGIMSENKAMEVLSAVSADNKAVSYPGEPAFVSNTQWSVIYNLDDLTATACIGHDYSKKYEYSLTLS